MTKRYPKSGKRSKLANKHREPDRDVSPENRFGYSDFGGSRPGTERRWTGNYLKAGQRLMDMGPVPSTF